jgi:hypothetical protein
MKDEALKLALEALRSAAAELYRASSYCNTYKVLGNTNDAITAIQQALAAPVQEPVVYCDLENWLTGKVWADDVFSNIQHKGWSPLYTTPPAAQRQWAGLTDEEKRQIFEREDYQGWLDYINAIEAKLKERNT